MEKPKLKKIRLESISLKPESSEKISLFLEQIKESSQAAKITRGDLVNYLINSLPSKLKGKHIREISEYFFDIEGLLTDAIKKVREAKKQGGMIKLSEVLPAKQKRSTQAKNNSANAKTRGKNQPQEDENKSPENQRSIEFNGDSYEQKINE